MHEYKAKVIRIIDGDTVDLEIDLGFYIKLSIRGRLKGVNTPERGDVGFLEATDQLSKLLKTVGTTVEIDDNHCELFVIVKTEKTEKYGRWLIEIDGVNQELAIIWPYK